MSVPPDFTNDYFWLVYDRWPKLIPIYNEPSFVPIVTHLAGNHLDRHADLDGIVVYIGQLGGDHRSFVQFDEGYGVGGAAIVSAGRFVDSGEGIDFTFAAECIKFLGFIAAVWADVTRRKNFIIAVRADLSHQPVALFLESPMSWNFHSVSSFLHA